MLRSLEPTEVKSQAGPVGSWERLHPGKSLTHQGPEDQGGMVLLCGCFSCLPHLANWRREVGRHKTQRVVAPWGPNTPASGPLSKSKTRQKREFPHALQQSDSYGPKGVVTMFYKEEDGEHSSEQPLPLQQRPRCCGGPARWGRQCPS